MTGGNSLLNCFAEDLEVIADGVDGLNLKEEKLAQLVAKGFKHVSQSHLQPSSPLPLTTISRQTYSSMYGPTTGDRIRLADTELWIEIEKDFTNYGDELKFGGGKVIREGMGQQTGAGDQESLDLVVTNCTVVDWKGVWKADVGVKNHIVGLPLFSPVCLRC